VTIPFLWSKELNHSLSDLIYRGELPSPPSPLSPSLADPLPGNPLLVQPPDVAPCPAAQLGARLGHDPGGAARRELGASSARAWRAWPWRGQPRLDAALLRARNPYT
jgi:hypothetical protein